MINVSVGSWIQKGDVIALFLALNTSAHVHFDVKENGVRRRLDLYWSFRGKCSVTLINRR
ncbi:MAG: hypothetical protein ACTSU2_12085 [Promethearchaeota archaeon]